MLQFRIYATVDTNYLGHERMDSFLMLMSAEEILEEIEEFLKQVLKKFLKKLKKQYSYEAWYCQYA